MTKLRYVIERGGWFEFRLTVPKDLQAHYGKTAITEPLHTKDPLEAQKKAEALAEEYKVGFAEVRMPLKPASPLIIESTYRAATGANKSALEQNSGVYELYVADRISRLTPLFEDMRTGTVKVIDDYAENRIADLKSCIQEEDHGLSADSLEQIRIDYLEDGTSLLLVCQKVCGNVGTPNVVLLRRAARAVIEILIEGYTRLRYETLKAMKKIPESILSADDLAALINREEKNKGGGDKDEPQLSTVLDECLSEKTRGVTTVEDLRSSVALLIEWFDDDKPISFYTRERMKSFVDNCLLHLPPNRNKVKKWQDYKLKDMVKKTKPEDLIAPDTMHNILSNLTTVFTYAVDEYHEFISRHPTAKLSSKLPEKIDDVDRSFTDDELKKMLNNLTYDMKNPSRYWVVMLGLFSGARLNELCQLHLNDVQRLGGMDCICINIDDADQTFKRVKNKPSRRTVPIHPELLKTGFMGYVKQRKKDAKGKNEQLFPELIYKEKSGYGRQVGDWFGRYKKKIKVIDSCKRGFHGFRHTFIMWAQNEAEMSDREILELTGHETKTISKDHRRYAHALTVKRLNAQLVKLDYGLKISANPFMK